jgi:UDP-glucuronate decarboxylase
MFESLASSILMVNQWSICLKHRTKAALFFQVLAVSISPPLDSEYLSCYFLSVNPLDGRVVSNFIVQALRGEDMTVYGDGKQTRSFQYVHDLVDGLIVLMNSEESRPVNIGNGDEFTIGEFAELVREIVEKVQDEDGVKPARQVEIIYKAMPTDDPQRRRPDTTRAKEVLGWQPKWTVRMGLEEMVRYYKAKMAEGSI